MCLLDLSFDDFVSGGDVDLLIESDLPLPYSMRAKNQDTRRSFVDFVDGYVCKTERVAGTSPL